MLRATASLAGMACLAALAVSENRTLADHAFVRVIGDWEQSDGGKSLEQQFRFADDLAGYGLTYTIAIPAGTPPGKCTSRVWAFKTKDVTLGISAPVGANWYTQTFSSVRIDGLSLHDIPGRFRIVRADGDDALVEGLWDTPKGRSLNRRPTNACPAKWPSSSYACLSTDKFQRDITACVWRRLAPTKAVGAAIPRIC